MSHHCVQDMGDETVQAPRPPRLPELAALFLDLDGSLIEIAAQPDAVRVPDGLTALLAALRVHLHGALAIISGRKLEQVDALLAPLRLAGAGVHGAQWRASPNAEIAATVAASLGSLLETLREYFADDPRILIEDKGLAVAVHFRAAPERAGECDILVADLAKALALTVKRGRCVVEVLPPGPSKGAAVRALMARAPFAGRVPFYLGDDLTDEDGIYAAQMLGGCGIKVGTQESVARYRLADVAAVHRWLAVALPSITT